MLKKVSIPTEIISYASFEKASLIIPFLCAVRIIFIISQFMLLQIWILGVAEASPVAM